MPNDEVTDAESPAPRDKRLRHAPLWRTLIAFPAAVLLAAIGFVLGIMCIVIMFSPPSPTADIAIWIAAPSGAIGGLAFGLRLGGFRWLTALGAACLIAVSVASTILFGILTAR